MIIRHGRSSIREKLLQRNFATFTLCFSETDSITASGRQLKTKPDYNFLYPCTHNDRMPEHYFRPVGECSTGVFLFGAH